MFQTWEWAETQSQHLLIFSKAFWIGKLALSEKKLQANND